MQTLPKSLHIGVIRGGISSEYEDSLQSGAHILQVLSETHKPIDILISKDGTWHINGIERPADRIFKHVDVVWNALHGELGEDGVLQEILNHHGIPYTGSDRLSSALSSNKIYAKDLAKKSGIKTPVYMVVRKGESVVEKAKEIWGGIPHPLIVKPANVHVKKESQRVDSFTELCESLEKVLKKYDIALVEECITGKSAECLVTEDFRGQKIYAFPPDGKLTKKEKNDIEEAAKKIHKVLKLHNYSNSSFIVSPRRGVYFISVNPSPYFGKSSHAHKVIESVGSNVKDFFHHILSLTL